MANILDNKSFIYKKIFKRFKIMLKIKSNNDNIILF